MNPSLVRNWKLKYFTTEATNPSTVDSVETEQIVDSDAFFEVVITDENSEEWFGKKVSEKAIDKAYIVDDSITAEKIEATRIFAANRELVDFETIAPGTKCSVFLEFAGLWFARSHFGPTWNIVQVKIHEEKTPEVEVPSVDAYPEECMFEDEESK